MSWVDADSDFTFSGKQATCKTTPTSDTKFNCLFKDGGATKGDRYWELKAIKGNGIWFGVTNEQSFGKGYENKGMMYGGPGNVANGGGLLISQFGPKISEGDKLGCLCEFKANNRLVVIFYHNGQCLGPAFDLQSDSWSSLFPVASCNSKGDAFEINDSAAVPSVRCRSEPGANKGLIGKWRSPEFDCVLDVTGDSSNVELTAKVMNTMRSAGVHKDGDKWEAKGPCTSTMMAGPPDMMKKEQHVTQVIDGLKEMKVQSQNLVMSGGSHEIAFQPYTDSGPEPITDLSRLRLVGA